MKDIVIRINSSIHAEGEEPHLMEMTFLQMFILAQRQDIIIFPMKKQSYQVWKAIKLY